MVMAVGKRGFVLTPHKVSLSMLTRLCVPAILEEEEGFTKLLADPIQRQRIAAFLIKQCTACDNFLEPPLEEFIIQLKEAQKEIQEDMPHYLLHFLDTLRFPNDLVDVLLHLRDLLPRPSNDESDLSHMEGNEKKLNPNSVLGHFVRRCILAFNSTSFEEICHLWENICSYHLTYTKLESNDSLYLPISPLRLVRNVSVVDVGNFDFPIHNQFSARQHDRTNTEMRLTKKWKHNSHFSQPSEEAQGSVDKHMFLRTQGQVDAYLRVKADFIEQQVALVPMNQFETNLNMLQKLAPECHRVYYLRYLNNIYHGDYSAALNNFHKYFDYSAGKETVDNGGAMSNGRFQAVLLSLGTMHSLFGHPAHALAALTSAIQEAQQASDNSCLAHILGAICFLLSEIGLPDSSSNSELTIPYGIDMGAMSSLAIQEQLPVLLKRCLNRAIELKLTHLVLLSHLALAKFHMKHVQRAPLSFGLKISTKLRTQPIDVCRDLRLSCYALSESGIDPRCSVVGAPLSDLSVRSLSRPNGSLLLAGDGSCSRGPIARSIMQLSGSSYLARSISWELYGSSPLVRLNALIHVICYADSASADDLSLAYVKLIEHLADYKGYKEAFAALELIENKFLCVYKSRIRLLKLQLVHDRAIHRGELKIAQHILNQLSTLASPLSGIDMELKVEATLRHARTLLAAGQFGKATSVAQSLFCLCYKYNLQVESTNVLLLLGEIHKRSENPISGLPYVLAALSLCQHFNLDLLQATCMLSLGELWLSVGHSHSLHALALVHQGLPIILGHGGLELRARANLIIAKCHLSRSDYSVSEDPDTVLDPLKQAAKEFETLEYHELAGKAFYLMAIVYNSLGNFVERNIAASSFQRHVEDQNHARMQEPSMISV